MNRSKSLVGFKAAFTSVSRCPLLGVVLDYILVSLLISSYLLLPSTFNLLPYFKLNINRILSKDYFYSDFIDSGKYEFKMGLEVVSCRFPLPGPPIYYSLRERAPARGAQSPQNYNYSGSAAVNFRAWEIYPQNNYADKN